MSSASLARLAALVLVALLALAAAPAPPAGAAPSLLAPKPTTPVVAPVADPISADPAGAVRGTVIMVHAGGWAGHDANAQEILFKNPGGMFLQRGWRVVSIDYEEGTAGLQDVLTTASAELARRGTAGGPVCIYGESAGGHLALVAASQLRTIDCVMTLGAPTDLALYEADGSLSADARVRLVASQARRFFGTTTESRAPWDPVSLAPKIHADVLLMHEGDDAIVPQVHDTRFQAARPTSQVVTLEAGVPPPFVHGTISAGGRGQYAAALGAFADRAVADHNAEIRAARLGCSAVDRTVAEAGLAKVQRVLRCLARNDAASRRAGIGDWRKTSFKLAGEINAARIWSYLRGRRSGQHALAAAAKRRAQVSVRIADRSRVTLRAR